MKKPVVALLFSIFLFMSFVTITSAWTPLPVANDPLVRMPGTQPGQVSIEAPGRCFNCHAGYNTEVEPGFNWQGSMMAQSARDFLYWSCLVVAAQDSIWALGTPNAVDLCERCHFPKGWLEGRSDPPNASAMTGADFDGVQCDFCHTSWNPFFESTNNGIREGSDWRNYWDETNNSRTPSQPAATDTYNEDIAQSLTITAFNGTPFFENNLPFSLLYTENAAGQYFVSANSDKRASFADAAARHQMLYSRYHKSKYFCDTCHDVSNPVFANLGADSTQKLPSESKSAFSYIHVERTFSEFRLSAYGQQGGADGIGPFAPSGFNTSDPDNKIRMCQDCHMRDVRGVACNKRGVPVRPDESVEHPNSGQPLHDMTGGNAWVSYVLASATAGSPNYDATNAQLLNQGPALLTLDLNQGLGIDPAALLAGVDRSRQQLLLAAAITNLNYNSSTGALSFQVQNQTGHKLISGFPEGRRMFVNIKAYTGTALIYEINPYDSAAGTLKGLSYPYQGNGLPDPQSLGPNERYEDSLVYEMHPQSSLTGESETFHFALADGRYKDNRIPPKGFRIADAGGRLSVPVWHGTEDPGYYTSAEYAGGYDAVSLTIPAGADRVEVRLYYQTTSREYIEFLRNEINGTGYTTLAGTGAGGDPAYIAQSDPFFSGLAAWGNTIWQLWTHNMNVDGAKPFLMAQASTGSTPACTAPIPTLLSAQAGQQQVTLTWSDESAGASGYKVYYDQSGKAQLVADAGSSMTFTDTNLTNGVEYCYKITSYNANCESGFSNVMCAVPENQGQTTDPAGVTGMESGYYSGKGKNQTFVQSTNITAGDDVVIRMRVINGAGDPVSNATVSLVIGGPENASLNSNSSDSSGWAEATWNTQSPNRKGQGGTTTGQYTATVTDISATGYHWNGVTTSITFNLQ